MVQAKEELFAVVSTKGQMVIPAAIREALGIEPGTRVAVRQEGAVVVLRPETLAAKLSLIEKMHGCTAGGGSGTDMLLEDRRIERERELREEGW
ncbi:MAG: AbrB/MazE/SpoVT family DNA-binding domain-containing protein [Terracidiphilus sp.]